MSLQECLNVEGMSNYKREENKLVLTLMNTLHEQELKIKYEQISHGTEHRITDIHVLYLSIYLWFMGRRNLIL